MFQINIHTAIEKIDNATTSFAKDSLSNLKDNLCGTLKLAKAELTQTGSVGEIVVANIINTNIHNHGKSIFQKNTIAKTVNKTFTTAKIKILK